MAQFLVLLNRNMYFSGKVNKKVILGKFDKPLLIFRVHWNNIEC